MPEPRLRFLIGGAQKAGTTALARYLALHPEVALPRCKEAHVFDAVDFDDAWTTRQVDGRFAPQFDDWADNRLVGDATPISVFHPAVVTRVARYNPAMRWVLLLRDPVERAISHYFMERARGAEARSLLIAVLAERGRLRGHECDWSDNSPLRTWSYVARGRYVRQLDGLFARFPRDQVLLLCSRDLSAQPEATMARVLAFLGLPAFPRPPDFSPAFEGRYRPPARLSPGRLLLRLLLRGEVDGLREKYGVDLRP